MGATKTISFEYTYSSTGDDVSNHNLTKMYDSKNQVYVTNTYNTQDRVATQVDGSGTNTYTYTLSGTDVTKNTVVDRVGDKTEYTYDANGNNTEIKYYNSAQTASKSTLYTYDANGFMLTQKSPLGNGIKYTYDTSGNLTQMRKKTDITVADSSNDLVTSYTYTTYGLPATITNPE